MCVVGVGGIGKVRVRIASHRVPTPLHLELARRCVEDRHVVGGKCFERRRILLQVDRGVGGGWWVVGGG